MRLIYILLDLCRNNLFQTKVSPFILLFFVVSLLRENQLNCVNRLAVNFIYIRHTIHVYLWHSLFIIFFIQYYFYKRKRVLNFFQKIEILLYNTISKIEGLLTFYRIDIFSPHTVFSILHKKSNF
jgi:hypothetical protein